MAFRIQKCLRFRRTIEYIHHIEIFPLVSETAPHYHINIPTGEKCEYSCNIELIKSINVCPYQVLLPNVIA